MLIIFWGRHYDEHGSRPVTISEQHNHIGLYTDNREHKIVTRFGTTVVDKYIYGCVLEEIGRVQRGERWNEQTV